MCYHLHTLLLANFLYFQSLQNDDKLEYARKLELLHKLAFEPGILYTEEFPP